MLNCALAYRGEGVPDHCECAANMEGKSQKLKQKLRTYFIVVFYTLYFIHVFI